MKKTSLIPMMLVFAIIIMTACGDGNKVKEVEISKKAAMLLDKTWTPDLNATIKEATDGLDSTSNIKANFELKGDVKGIADFMAGTLRFGKDNADKTKLSYERKYGKGLLSTSVVGYWTLNEGETAVIMKEWNSQLGKEKDPISYEIVELTETRLVLLKEGEATPDIYVVK